MCGGNLTVTEGMTVYECECCNIKQTVPTIDDEKKVKLFDRANRLRMECQFDNDGSVHCDGSRVEVPFAIRPAMRIRIGLYE